MRKNFLFIALLAGSVSLSQAQPRQMGTPEERAERQTAMLEKQLKLTADQKAKIYTVILTQAKETDSLRTAARNAGEDRQAMWSKMQEIQKKHSGNISSLLTADQKKTYDQWLEEMRSRRGRGPGGPGGQQGN
ncbi:hypothetical protein [Pararcticibacter amylolyticus]|uniref:DUF4890 domain-containing protein n=1 Tax=Pararcticibacter amylolyticus TaxID=2173175 RepID=A0A2U2PJZ6_9SPHI|nr:hypothetical protein [Pararcticibacter amylolyticus]PWG81725.1 hypothetical protein DDR33_04995 [Pararcticibacter amylolyticus]